MSNQRILVFAATLNERDNIADFTRLVLDLSPQFDLLIVDDNSPDGTGRLLKHLQQFDERLKVIHRPQKLGLGSAHELAMVYAVKHGYELLVTMDADFSHNPEDIPRLIEKMSEADFVIGSRYCKGGGCDYKGYRRGVSIIANSVARLLLGVVPLHEFTTSFRVFRVSLLRKLDYARLRSRGYSFFMETVGRIYRQGFRVAEVPIHFSDRKAGDSKIPRYEIFRGMYRLLLLTLSRFAPVPRESEGLELDGLTCYACSSPYLIKLHSEQITSTIDANAYKCTSMNHRSIPQVVSCLECGLDFVPRREGLSELYSEVVDEEYLEFKEARYKTFEKAYEKISGYLSPKAKLLEVGAYCGFFMDIARKQQIDVDGVEPSKWATSYAREVLGLEVHQGSLDDVYPRLKKDYDAVAMWDVLEHLSDPLKALKQVNSVLKDGGHLFLSTLDIDNWFPKLTGARWPWLMHMHVFYFRTPSLQFLLRKSGFEIVQIKTYSHYISSKYLVDKLIALMPRFFTPALKLLRLLMPKGVFILFRFGDIKLYICQKVA